MTLASLSMVSTILSFGGCTMLAILTQSPSAYVCNVVTDSVELSKSSAGDKGVGGVWSLSVRSLALASLSCRRIEASYILNSCKSIIGIFVHLFFFK